jgi:hypothetical protein
MDVPLSNVRVDDNLRLRVSGLSDETETVVDSGERGLDDAEVPWAVDGRFVRPLHGSSEVLDGDGVKRSSGPL